MVGVAVLFILAGFLQLWAGVAAALRKGELKTTQGRQLESVLGRKGTVAFFLTLGGLLTGGGVLLLMRATV